MSASRRLPNIVYILADDLGYGDVSCRSGDGLVPAPHTDRADRAGDTHQIGPFRALFPPSIWIGVYAMGYLAAALGAAVWQFSRRDT